MKASFMALAIAGALPLAATASDSMPRQAEVQVCKVFFDPLLSKNVHAPITCGEGGLGVTTLGKAYAEGWRIKAVLDTSQLCNKLAPCAVLFLER